MFSLPYLIGGDIRFNIVAGVGSGNLHAGEAHITARAHLSGHIQVGPPGGQIRDPIEQAPAKIIYARGHLICSPARLQCRVTVSWHDYNHQALLILLAA